MSALSAILRRDIRLAVRVGGGAWIGVLFFLIVVTLVPLALGPDLALLARIGPAILWLGACSRTCSRSTGSLPWITRTVRST
jgi:heme exporter protein B